MLQENMPQNNLLSSGELERLSAPTQVGVSSLGASLSPQELARLSGGTDPLGATSSFSDVSRVGTREQGRTRQQVQSSTDMASIREYMKRRKGTQFTDRTDEEVYDAFVNHMRFMNVNEITTIGEMTWASKASEEDKAIAANAYDTYQSLGNVFVNDGVAGAFDGVADYGRAILTSPSTYLGGVVGRIAIGSATKAGVSAVNATAGRAAIEAAKATAVREAAAKGISGQAASQLATKAADTAAREIAGQAARVASLKQIGVAGAVDAATNTLQDYMYQSVMMEAGVQDDYSVIQGGISALAGGVGAGVASIPYAFKGVTGLSEAQTNIAASFSRAKEQNLDRLGKEAAEGFDKLKGSIEEWIEAAKRGDVAIDGNQTVSRKITEELLTGENNLFEVFGRARFIFDDGPDAAPKTQQLIEAFKAVGDIPAKQALDKMMQEELGLSLGQALDIVSMNVRQGALDLNAVRQGIAKVSAASRQSQRVIDEALSDTVEEAVELEGKHIQYLTSVWRRSIVSHPATTAVNIQGWGIATTANTIAQILHGGTVGSMGMITRLAAPFSSSAKAFSDKQLIKSANLFKAEAFQIKTLLDPTTTKQSFEALMSSPNMARKDRELLQEALFGGIDTTGPISYNLAKSGKELKAGAKGKEVRELQELLKVPVTAIFDKETDTAVKKLQASYGFPQTGKVGRQEWAALTSGKAVAKTEKVLNKFAIMSGVKVQDMYTKANSFLYALNKESLDKLGKPLGDVIAEGRAFDITEDMFAKATRTALDRTFSADLTKEKTFMRPIYEIVERISTMPGLGFIFPFGRFVNNNFHFLMEYNPLGLFPDLYRMVGKTKNTEEVMESAFRRVTGLGALMYLAQWQNQNEAEGKLWNQVEDRQGDVSDRTNVAPISFYMLGGRIMNNIMNGQEVPAELIDELRQQIGTDFLDRGVTGTTDALYEAIGYMSEMLSNGVDKENLQQLVGVMGNTFLGIASGFTRPLEPLNVIAGYGSGNAEGIDRRQLDGTQRMVAEGLRYTDKIFDNFLQAAGQPSLLQQLPQRESIALTTTDYNVNEASRITGTRLSAPITDINRMLAAVDLPVWRVQERSSIPELDAKINSKASRLLEARARELMRNPMWRDGTKSQRRLMVNQVISDVKKETRDWVAEGTMSDATLVAQRKWTGLNTRHRSAAKEYFGLSDVEDTDLNYFQIQQMEEWIKWYRELLKDQTDR
jgi:hypothetical protein